MEPAPASIARQDHVLDKRIDLVLPALAGEHAVMADAGLHVMPFKIRTKVGAQVVRGNGLADRADIVAFALDLEQHGAADRGGLDLLSAPLKLAERKGVFLED